MKKFKTFNIKNIIAITYLLIVLSLSLTGCGKEDSKTDTAGGNIQQENIKFEDESYIVDAEWLKENLENDEVLILDARGEEAYKKGHIPGSIAVTWQQFSDMNGKPGDENWGTVLEAKELSQKFSEVGIDKDKKIVVYCDTLKGWGEDGRIVWMLRGVGVENAVILDGGFNYWKSEGNEISKEITKPTPSTIDVSSLNGKVNIKTEELSDKLKQVKIIDVRSKKEYDGATNFGEPRGGHIPSSINIEFTEFLNKNGTFKSPFEIKAILDENKIDKSDQIVTYCTAGIRSAHMQLVLNMLGYNNSKNYDQSFNGWAGNKELEVEK